MATSNQSMQKNAQMQSKPGFIVPEIKHLTKQDVIEYLRQQAWHLGEFGLSCNFIDMNDIVKGWERSVATSGVVPPTVSLAILGSLDEEMGEEKAVQDAMNLHHKVLGQMQFRQKLLNDPRNRSAVEAAEKEIDQKLRAAGVPEDYIKKTILRKKVAELINLSNPQAKANYTTMLMCVPAEASSRTDLVQINMPLKADIEDVNKMLDSFLNAQIFHQTGYVPAKDAGWSPQISSGWKYQIVGSDRKVANRKSIKLDTDQAYKDLITRLSIGKTQPGSIWPILTKDYQVMRVPESKPVFKMPEEEEECVPGVDDLVDEDGKPYFERIDWEEMGNKLIEMTLERGTNEDFGAWEHGEIDEPQFKEDEMELN